MRNCICLWHGLFLRLCLVREQAMSKITKILTPTGREWTSHDPALQDLPQVLQGGAGMSDKLYQILEDGSLLLANGEIIPLDSELTASVAEANDVLDQAGISRYSDIDEMPPDRELSLAERIRRLARRAAR